MKEHTTKVYVNVILRNTKEGVLRPLIVEWTDGLSYEVDRVKDVVRAASTKVGGCGIRYTIMIAGKETYLFHEDDRWFVEAKHYTE